MVCSQRLIHGESVYFTNSSDLLFNVRKAALVEVAHHVRRHAENARDLVNLKFARFQELRLLR